MATKTLMEVEFEDGTTFELLEFLSAAENAVAEKTAYIPISMYGTFSEPKRARLLEDDGDFTLEITDGDWVD